jgi:spore germination cell wall hydrolase CwlJ-like protein
MRILKTKRVPETIALALCIAVLLTAWAQVIAQECKQDKTLEIKKSQNSVEEKQVPYVEASEEKGKNDEAEVKAVAEETIEMEVAVTEEEYDLLARAVYSEARGEPFQGQVAIAAVILNRVEHRNFPDTINDVIFQPSAFTAVQDGQFWLTPNSTAYKAVEKALEGIDPSGGAIFYYNPATASNQWIRSRQVITAIGKHVFAI